MRLALTVCLTLAASPALAEDLVTVLSGHKVIYAEPGAADDNPPWQEWNPDGTTRTGGGGFLNRKSGHWKVDKGRYCEIFGVSEEWTCWKVTFPAKGRVRFWQIPRDMGDMLFHQDMKGYFTP